MITKTQKLKQCVITARQLKSWLLKAECDPKQINFLEDLMKVLDKSIKEARE